MLPVGRLVGLWFATKRGRMMGLIASGNNFGGMIAVPIITAVIVIGGWRWGFASTGFLLIGVLTMLSRLFGPDFTSDLKFFVFLGVTGLPLGLGSGAGWYFNEQSYDET